MLLGTAGVPHRVHPGSVIVDPGPDALRLGSCAWASRCGQETRDFVTLGPRDRMTIGVEHACPRFSGADDGCPTVSGWRPK
jgi:hypothetical protein